VGRSAGSALGWTIPLADAFWGAVAGYLSLWTVYWVFKLATGKEGMGFGDFKLLAALGAWLGWKMICRSCSAPPSSAPSSESR
jgi:leader peptidase (prepilin peptidase)/N-methyltransferase